MKKKSEIKNLLLNANAKIFEKELKIKIRNGQAIQGIKATLDWVLK